MISVDVQLPKPGQRVICYGRIWGGEHVEIGELVDVEGHRWADWGVTHWVAIPDSPDQVPAETTNEVYHASQGRWALKPGEQRQGGD